MNKRLRFKDLRAIGLVSNRVTLRNWILGHGFPPGQLTGPNSRTWGEQEIQDWLDSRPTASKRFIPASKPRGRPRKVKLDITETA